MSAWAGGHVTERVTCVLEANPGPMTLDGTNTYVLAEPGSSTVVVVDPGEDDPEHLDRVAATAQAGGRSVGLVLLTHGHHDHAAGALPFAAAVGAPVRAVDPSLCRDGAPLAEERVELGGLVIDVLHTPGHTRDSASFVLVDDAGLLTGDTVLGRGTTVLGDYPGSLSDYLGSLRRLADRVVDDPLGWLLPGHGPTSSDPERAIAAYRAHREQRLDQVRAALRTGAGTPREVVEIVYADVDRSLWPAAEQSVRAQLEHLKLLGRPDSG